MYSYQGDLKDYPKGPEILDVMAFEEPMSLFAEGRRFCTTVNGYMGWVPQNAHSSDFLCIPKGAEVPFLLRSAIFTPRNLPRLIRPGAVYYQIIEECYILGMMAGEFSKTSHTGWMDIMLC
jgi:hypothetical protein